MIKLLKNLLLHQKVIFLFVEPRAWHRVTPLTDDLECYLEFYCEPKNYFSNKYELNPAHSEVVEAVKTIKTT